MTERDIIEEIVARWVSELPPVEADPAFREALRSRFVSGEAAITRAEPEPIVLRPRRLRRPRWWGLLVPVAGAAVLTLVIVVMNHGPALRVVGTSGAGSVRINDRDIAINDMEALNASVKTGARIEVPPNAAIDLMVDGVVLYELAGGTEATLPVSPGRWRGGAAEANLFTGEMRIKTGGDFAGNVLRVRTPEGIAEITGTLLSVQCNAGGTCVCVQEGVARVGAAKEDMAPVEPGYRKVMPRDGTAGIRLIEATHRDGLVDFDRRVGGRM